MHEPAAQHTLRRRIESGLFDGILAITARIAQTPGLRLVILPFMEAAAFGVRQYRKQAATSMNDPHELGKTWQRLMPNPKVMPITHVDDITAYGEIRVHCPLRGTGDVAACHRLMAYDRALMRPMGARFVVLQSQAEPHITTCKIAIRPAEYPAEDLVSTHLRFRNTEPRKLRDSPHRQEALTSMHSRPELQRAPDQPQPPTADSAP